MARPTDYTEPLGDVICEGISAGDSLRTICAAESLPDRSTVFRWLAAHESFATKYAYARAVQTEFHHDEMDKIESDTLSGDLNPQAASVVLANKRWRMEKLKPKVYGARQVIAGDPDAPLVSATEDQIDARINALLKTALDANPASGDSE